MINVIVPIVENVEKFSEFIKMANSQKDIKFFVGIRQDLAKDFKTDSKNIEVHVFKNASKREEIINSLHTCKMKKGKLLIVRRPLTSDEFNAIISSDKDIATLKVNGNKFIAAIKKFAKTLISKFFAFSYFDDISAICYKENMFELLSVCPNLSMASRVNKYCGVEIDEPALSTKETKRDYSRPKNILGLILGTLVFLGTLAGFVCGCIFIKPLQVLIVISLVCLLIVALLIWFVSIINFTRTLTVGQLRYGRAEEISK